MTDSEVSPVPIETDDQRRTFEFLVPRVTSEAELLQFHAVDAMICALHEKRLAENKRLMDMEKLWEARKAELEPQLQAMVVAAQASGSKSAQSMLASTFTKDREDKVLLPQGPEEENEIIGWVNELDYAYGFEFVEDTDYEMVPRITKAGSERLKNFVIDRARLGLDIPPGVVFTPGGKTVVTRHRSSAAPGAGPRLTPQQILAQRGDLDKLLPQGPEEGRNDSETS